MLGNCLVLTHLVFLLLCQHVWISYEPSRQLLIDTFKCGTKWLPFHSQHSQVDFREWKRLYYDQNFGLFEKIQSTKPPGGEYNHQFCIAIDKIL